MPLTRSLRAVQLITVLLALFALTATPAVAGLVGPVFSKAFTPATIGPGSSSTLVFTIDNSDSPLGVADLAFTDVLPAGVTIASPGVPSSTCGPTSVVSAPDGGGTIIFSDGTVGAGQICEIAVEVTSSTPGTHMNTSGDLTSDAGNSGPAQADLMVVTDRPGFSKSFSPVAVGPGQRSTLTFSIDNTANASTAYNLSFVDNLPVGVVVASPANVAIDCTGGTVTAVPGSGTVTYGPQFSLDASVLAMATCTVSVDVIGAAIGTHDNVSGDLTSFLVAPTQNSGHATATLDVTGPTDPLVFTKSFTDDPVNPGGTVTLEFTIANRDRDFAATGVTFTDDLDATLSGLAATGLPMNDVCGAGSQISGVGLLTLTGGNLPANGGECTFSVTLQVPAGATAGAYPNTTSTVSGDIDGSPVVGNAAMETLFVNDAPTLTKTFLTDPIGAGDAVTVEFTITNTSSTSSATDFAFTDNLSAFISGVTVTALPAAGFCGAGSLAFTSTVIGDLFLNVSGGDLAASDSCTFSVDLQTPPATPAGTYLNTTNDISATVDGTTQVGQPAADTLTVSGAPRLRKSFTDDPVAPGGTVTLEFTISHDVSAATDATSITFSDDLNAVVAGLSATGLPANDVCGAGSSISGTTNLTFVGGTLAPGASCTFPVTLSVPGAALPGTYPNATSNVQATVGGVTTTGSFGSDDLDIAGLEFTKEFIDDPTIPGDTATLRFTIDNTGTADATGMLFTDNLSTTLAGLSAIGLPMNDVCGTGSSISGPTFLILAGGNLLAGTSCTFDVTVQVPAAAADGQYANTTSNLIATYGGTSISIGPATDTLVVVSELLASSKTFTDDPVNPGDTVTLEFTIDNLDPINPATAISFTDDLNAALSGLAAIGLPSMNVCGAGSDISGTTLLTLTGGSLPAGGSCTFSVTLQVPAAAVAGAYPNTTSAVSGTINGFGVTGDPATDTLVVEQITFSKAFDGPTVPGGTPTLTFTIENQSTTTTVTDLGFTDDLDATLTGLVATGLPMNDVCGLGSSISGTSFLAFAGGNLLPNSSCTIIVSLQVPGGAAPGSYPNTTSDLSSSGLSVSTPATDDLEIEPPPTFAKTFAPDSIAVGQSSTLTFTIDNSASALAATSLDYTDNLPAAVAVAAPPSASTTCTGGTITAVAGTGVVSYSGGTVAAGASCTVQVDTTSSTPGAHLNTSGDLTSSSGNSGPASDTLTVSAPPAFAKAFAPNPISVGGVSTLTFTIDNTASALAAMVLDFTDNLPAAVVVAAPPSASTTCTGGTITAAAGTGVVSYSGGTVAAGASCIVQVDTTSSTPGAHLNTSGDLTSSTGNSGPASDTLTVVPPPAFAKSFAPNPIIAGGVSTLTFTIDNTASALVATGLDFTDNLPAAVTVAAPANPSTTCTGGTVTAVSGTGVISYTGGTVAAGESCTVQVDTTSSTAGSHVNLTGDLTSSLGTSGTATDTLTVNLVPPTFTKTFVPDAIIEGGVSTLQFVIDNTGGVAAVGNLDFTDDLPAGVVVASPANVTNGCTGGTVTAVSGTGTISYSGGTVGAASTCQIDVDVTSTVGGLYTNVTGDLTSDAGSSGTATDDLTVISVLITTKTFLLDPVLPAGFVDLEYTINNPSTVATTSIAFTDDLDTALPGLAAQGLPAADVCGAGSQLAGTSVLALTGGTLGPGASCTFSAMLQVPAGAVPGAYPSTTSPVTFAFGAVGGLVAPPATDTLDVIYLEFSKVFPDGMVLGGGTTTLEFTITNPDAGNPVTGMTFTDDLDAAVPGMTAVDTPIVDPCGAGSLFDGTSLVTLTNGSLGPGGSCTFAVAVEVPGDTPQGTYTNVTSVLDATVNGEAITGPAAAFAEADLDVIANPIAIPTVPWTGLLALALLLGSAGWWLLRRRPLAASIADRAAPGRDHV